MSDIRLHAGAAAGALAPREYHLAHEPHPENGTALGFWLYLMSDCLIFAALFATYGVLGRSYAAGPTGAQLFDLPLVALNTAFLLLSSITFGFAMLEKQKQNVKTTLAWLAVTGVLGLGFLGLELYEFSHLIHQGAGPQRSAFLSAFFTLVGTHGLHVATGLLWMAVLAFQALRRPALTERDIRRLTCLSLFWHFLDIVWICVFTFVYLASVI